MQTEVVVVISGKLEVRARQDDGSELLLAQIGPGETLGEISLFDPGPATATVTATEFSQLWRIADTDLMHFMEENPGAGNVLLRTLASILSQRVRQMNPRAFGLSTYAVIESPELPQESPEPEDEPETLASLPAGQPRKALVTTPAQATQTHQGERVSSKTQVLKDPDDFESEPL